MPDVDFFHKHALVRTAFVQSRIEMNAVLLKLIEISTSQIKEKM